MTRLEGWQQNFVVWYSEQVKRGNIINLGITYRENPKGEAVFTGSGIAGFARRAAGQARVFQRNNRHTM